MANFISSIKSMGLEGAKVYFQLKKGNVQQLLLKELAYPIHLRPNTFDAATFKQIFFRREYEIAIPFRPEVILDIGANIGLASVYFANRFKGSRIISVEPASDNFELLVMNTTPYADITAIQSALWSEKKHLRVVDNGQGTWGYSVEETSPDDPGAFASLSIKDIMDTHGLDRIDILKMDIEGSEAEVFSKNFEYWLARTRLLIMEFHERLVPGSEQRICSILDDYHFKMDRKGENCIFLNQHLR